MTETRPLLRLLAQDAEDLKAIAAVAQDAVAPLSDMAFLPEERRFVLAISRFRWETAAEAGRVYERIHCGLCFEGVTRVETRNFGLKQRGLILDLLTVVWQEGHVVLSFAGGRDIRLAADRLECRLDDFGEPWPTKIMPVHGAEAG
jgi:hypothetical protein